MELAVHYNFYSKKFYEEHGWASCFECDQIFYDIDKLKKHQSTCLEILNSKKDLTREK